MQVSTSLFLDLADRNDRNDAGSGFGEEPKSTCVLLTIYVQLVAELAQFLSKRLREPLSNRGILGKLNSNLFVFQ